MYEASSSIDRSSSGTPQATSTQSVELAPEIMQTYDSHVIATDPHHATKRKLSLEQDEFTLNAELNRQYVERSASSQGCESDRQPSSIIPGDHRVVKRQKSSATDHVDVVHSNAASDEMLERKVLAWPTLSLEHKFPVADSDKERTLNPTNKIDNERSIPSPRSNLLRSSSDLVLEPSQNQERHKIHPPEHWSSFASFPTSRNISQLHNADQSCSSQRTSSPAVNETARMTQATSFQDTQPLPRREDRNRYLSSMDTDRTIYSTMCDAPSTSGIHMYASMRWQTLIGSIHTVEEHLHSLRQDCVYMTSFAEIPELRSQKVGNQPQLWAWESKDFGLFAQHMSVLLEEKNFKFKVICLTPRTNGRRCRVATHGEYWSHCLRKNGVKCCIACICPWQSRQIQRQRPASKKFRQGISMASTLVGPES